MKITFRILTISLVVLALVFSCGKKSDPPVEIDDPPIVPPTKLVVNVRESDFGAKGDGNTDDTQAIQSAINVAAVKEGTVLVPAGTYRVNALTGIQLKSGITLKFEANAVLHALPNAADSYEIVGLRGVNHVTIIGGTIIGERDQHTGTTGQWGMGINIINARNVLVEGTVVKECWGDGFYISGASYDVTLKNVTADHNRRQGMSIISANTVLVRNSIFENTMGTSPEAGIDIEPNANETVRNVRIARCIFRNNAGWGFASGPPIAHTGISFVYDVVVDSCTVTGNMKRGIELSNCTGHKILNNTVSGNNGSGIYLRNSANNNLVRKNIVTGTVPSTTGSGTGYGIFLYLCQGDTITGNTITGNAGLGIRDAYPTGVNSISDNTLSNNGTK